MQIERISDNQIKCTLTEDDLRMRHLSVKDPSYGLESATALFHEMLDQASSRFDFPVEDNPITIDAIPTQSGGLVLIITRLENADELDPHFARFSESPEEAPKEYKDTSESADEILEKLPDSRKPLPQTAKAVSEDPDENDHVRIYHFDSLDQVIELAIFLKNIYSGSNSLFKAPDEDGYYLSMHSSWHTPEEFNQICNMMAEFAAVKSTRASREAYMAEHYKCLSKDTALQRLIHFS